MMGLMALCVASTAGLAAGAIWLGLAILIEEARKLLAARTPRQARAVHLTLDLVSAASFAAAPALAWFARVDMGEPLAVVMLAALVMQAAFAGGRGRVHALVACAPYGALGYAFLFEATGDGAFAPAAMAAIAGAYIFAAALNQAHRAQYARMQDAEWLRQLNMSYAESGAAAWEVDFERQRLIGADKLAALIGRDVTYQDVVSGAFAAPADRALVRGAFAPAEGATRRIAVEHQLRGGETNVRHQGFLRTTPDGAPVRLTCITRLSRAAQDRTQAISPDMLGALAAAQAQVLKTLSNELSTTLGGDAPAEKTFTGQLAALVARTETIERGVDALAHARHAAESANLAKSQFLANMSHELRTPLNAVIGYAEMLHEDAEDKGDDASVQDLNRILAAAKHLLTLLNEILDLSKIEAGRMEVSAAPFSPLEVFEDLVATARPLAEQNGNVLMLSGDGADLLANTDAMKLRQCVLNLLSNACKFTKKGKIEVHFETRAHNLIPHLFISVRDTGIGMSREQLARLFQPFVQADPTITQQYGGTGLGLTITRRLAQLMGGEVSVESVLGQGATFSLLIPANYADANAALGAAAEVDAVQGAEGAPLVIVIEDEPDARELAARALTRAGFQVQGVGGGEAGLALARAKMPALVLLDIFLPDRSGWRVLQSLKHDPKTADIPIVVLSVNEDRAHAMALGAAEHMVKPADRDKLAATVMRYARKRPPESSAPAASVTTLATKQAG
jgi:signal transduction histidine kinase/ActR/RegA family two-component response regulator